LWSAKCLRVFTHVIIIIDEQRQIDGNMAKHGSLFFTVSLILLSVKLPEGSYVWWVSIPLLKSIPTPTFSEPLKTAFFIVSFILIGIIKYIEKKFELVNSNKWQIRWAVNFIILLILLFALWIIPLMPLVAQAITLTISAIFIIAVFCKWLANTIEKLIENKLKSQYWLTFLFVYTIGWLRGFTSIPPNSFASNSIFIFGAIWFIVIVLIYFKSLGYLDKNN
jgi:hypothetical protein